MKSTLIIILIVLLSGFTCKKQERRVSGILTKANGKDSIINTFVLPDSFELDLKLCIDKFGYPPNIPTGIYWIKPDTTEFTNFEKQNIVFKYTFDQDGKLKMYYYQGSLVSGVFPIPYFFDYNSSKLISEISDGFYKTKYRIKYDDSMNIQWIEKLDSINKRIEILTISKK